MSSLHVLVDAARGAFALEVARAAVTAEIEVEDVEAGAGQMVGKRACRQVPRVPVLTEAVHQQDRGRRAAEVLGEPLSHHCQRHPPAGEHELLHERRFLAAVDGLFEGTAVEDQEANDPTFSVASA